VQPGAAASRQAGDGYQQTRLLPTSATADAPSPHSCSIAHALMEFDALQVGDVVVGTVQSVKPYGAFVDIGGVNGLLHISQISEDRVTNVEAVLSEGDKLKVRRLHINGCAGDMQRNGDNAEPAEGCVAARHSPGGRVHQAACDHGRHISHAAVAVRR
jgi:S1 RNA binding domain